MIHRTAVVSLKRRVLVAAAAAGAALAASLSMQAATADAYWTGLDWNRVAYGDCTLTVPLTPDSDDADTRLRLSDKKVLAVIEMFPPWPCVACARIWLFCRITKFGSMTIFPPVVVVAP